MESHRVNGIEPFVADLAVRGRRVSAVHPYATFRLRPSGPGGYALGSFRFVRHY